MGVWRERALHPKVKKKAAASSHDHACAAGLGGRGGRLNRRRWRGRRLYCRRCCRRRRWRGRRRCCRCLLWHLRRRGLHRLRLRHRRRCLLHCWRCSSLVQRGCRRWLLLSSQRKVTRPLCCRSRCAISLLRRCAIWRHGLLIGGRLVCSSGACGCRCLTLICSSVCVCCRHCCWLQLRLWLLSRLCLCLWLWLWLPACSRRHGRR